MAKITFIKSEDASQMFDAEPRKEYEKKFMSRADFDLAVEISNAGQGKDSALDILLKSRPEKILYAKLEDKLVPAVLVVPDESEDEKDEVILYFDDGTSNAFRTYPEEGDVLYTDIFEAIKETGFIVDKVNRESINSANDSSEQFSNTLADMFSKISDVIRNRKKIRSEVEEEIEQMSEEEREMYAKRASIHMRRLTLIQRRSMLTQMLSEVDMELSCLSKLENFIENPDSEEDDE